MWKISEKVAHCIWLAQIGGAAWALVVSLFSDEQQMIGNFNLPPGLLSGFYVFLIIFAIGMMIAMHWDRIYLRIFSEKIEKEKQEEEFKRMSPEIINARDMINNVRADVTKLSDGRTWMSIQSIVANLAIKGGKIKLKFPSTDVNQNRLDVLNLWGAFLIILAPLSEIGDIDSARKLKFEDGRVGHAFDA